MATRSLDSESEYLRKIAQLVAEAKFAPDADISFWIGIETTVLSKAHEGSGANPAAAQLPGNAVPTGPPPDMAGGLGAMLAGASAGAGGGASPGMAAGMAGPGGPAPAPMPGVRFTPDAMRQAMRPGVQGG